MTKPVHDIEALLEGLKQQRDSIRVQLHLAKAEVREEWDDLERQWEHLRAKAGVVGREVKGTSQDVFEATKLVAEELKRGYDRIRSRL